MAVRQILQLGNPRLWEVCDPVREEELEEAAGWAADLHDTLFDFRERFGFGRAIAAPQIGCMKRLVYMFVNSPTVFVNPVIEWCSDEVMELWDDCMSFPGIVVRLQRARRCRVVYRNLDWTVAQDTFSDGLSELLQHECDHLDGVLAFARAIDGRSVAFKSELVDAV